VLVERPKLAPVDPPVPSALPGWLAACVRLRYWLIALASLAYASNGYENSGGDFSFIRTGARVLVGLPAGFSNGSYGRFGIYAADPHVQVGPIAMLVTAPVAAFSLDTSRLVITVLMALALPLLLWLAEDAAKVATARTEQELGTVVLTAGLFSVPMWHQVLLFGHVDDALVMVCAAWSLRALARRQPVLLGLTLALAVDSKPWALGAVPLVLALPTGAQRLRAGATLVAGVVAAWTPFLLPSGALGGLLGFHIPVDGRSALTLIGVQTGSTMPLWARPAQLVVALVLVWFAVRQGRPAAALLVVVAARVALDAGAYSYYLTGLIIGCALYEIVGTDRRVAWLTALIAFVEYDITWLTNSTTVLAWINLSALAVGAVVLLVPAARARGGGESGLGIHDSPAHVSAWHHRPSRDLVDRES